MLPKTHLRSSENGNGDDGTVMLTVSPPELLRELAGRELPFNEIDEILLAFSVCEELERDAIDHVEAGYDQLAWAVALRMYYLERFRNLAKRIRRGDKATMDHLLGNPETDDMTQRELIAAQNGPSEVIAGHFGKESTTH